MLPEVHGFEIARRIKGSGRYRHIPIVMISAVYRGWRYAEDLKASCGVDHYIEKPFKISDVLRAVSASLSGPSSSLQVESDTSDAVAEALTAGVAAYRAGNIEQAIQHLERGARLDPLRIGFIFTWGFSMESRAWSMRLLVSWKLPSRSMGSTILL